MSPLAGTSRPVSRRCYREKLYNANYKICLLVLLFSLLISINRIKSSYTVVDVKSIYVLGEFRIYYRCELDTGVNKRRTNCEK